MSYLKGYAMRSSLGSYNLYDIQKAHDAAHGVTRRSMSGYPGTGGILDGLVNFLSPSSSDALPKQLQRETNRYAGVAFPTAIAEDGNIGASTVAAVRAVASFLIKQGAVQSDSFVQSGASANAAYILAHVSEYISIFDKEANRRGLIGKAPSRSSSSPPAQISLPTGPVEAPSLFSAGGGELSPALMLGGAALVYFLATRKKGKSGGRKKRSRR